ncbi:MAG UNVERIFIED_CONTAM: nucleotide sugar dehydrogenase, partial [Thermobifida fusca]
AAKLMQKGATLLFHDPHVPEWQVNGSPIPRADDLEQALGEADLTVLLTDHSEYAPKMLLERCQRLLDTRGVLRRADSELPGGRLTASISRKGVQVL